ncbi:MAG: class I SAM-dependent methyltransferase, partial [Pseudomonadota bacterium]
MRLKTLYEDVWTRKLDDPAWLAQDGKGRMEYAVRLLRELPGVENAHILDVGCGRGGLAYLLPDHTELHGVDISEKAVEEARKLYKEVHVVDLDDEPMPFQSSFFDICLMLDVIEHVLDPVVVVSKIAPCLKPGGLLILSTNNSLWW